MRLFLLSLGVLFATSLIGYVSIRMVAVADAPEVPPLPVSLWLSTAMLMISSATMQTAVGAARGGRQGRLIRALGITTLLGAGFLAVQVWCWIAWAAPMTEALDLAKQFFLLTGFYVLTGLHALHVLGGLVALVLSWSRSRAGRYTADDHAGVIYIAMYWHFLDAVWLVLFATLLIVI